MDKLSVVIITFNEEQTIGRCITSVRKIADEIVVVDSYSKDRTKERCLDLGVQFFEHPFEGHIQQKNYAKSLAKYDFVLSLDADEALDETLCNSILQAKEKFDCDGYSMNRMTNYCGKWIRHGSWYPDRKLRLWKKGKGVWGGRNPHDLFRMDPDGRIGHLKGDLLHYSYNSIEAHVNQFNQFTSISARELYSENYTIGITGIYVKALVCFIQGFFLKLGFLDGYYGTAICFINAFATFMKYMKVRELQRSGNI